MNIIVVKTIAHIICSLMSPLPASNSLAQSPPIKKDPSQVRSIVLTTFCTKDLINLVKSKASYRTLIGKIIKLFSNATVTKEFKS